jgi:hypothetical protein
VTQPKQHHFVPESFQARFTNADGRLFYFDRARPELGVRRGAPGNLFKQGHLYSVTDASGVTTAPFETRASKLEGRAGLVIDKIVAAARDGRAPGLTPAERRDWDDFFLLQWRRVPDTQRQSSVLADADRQFLDLLAKARARWPQRAAEIDARSTPDEVKRMTQNARDDSLERGPGTAKAVVAGRGLAVVHITDPRRGFVLGSLPVMKLTKPGQTDLRDHAVEMWLPVSSDTMVGVGERAGTERFIPTSDIRMIRSANASIVSQSSLFAGRSEAQIRSLAADAPAWSSAARKAAR